MPSGLRFTPEQFAQLQAKRGAGSGRKLPEPQGHAGQLDPAAPNADRPNKYRNTKTKRDGWNFDSKAEARHYDALKLLQRAGEVRWFHCQVPIRLPGHTTYRVDFLVMWADGTVTHEDVKGVETPEFKMKARQVLDLYGIEIKLITDA